jgi:hypothetical protein
MRKGGSFHHGLEKQEIFGKIACRILCFTTVKHSSSFPISLEKSGNPNFILYK